MSKYGAHVQGRGVLNSTGTATIIPAGTGLLHINAWCMSTQGAAGAEAAVYETTASGTAVGTCFTWHASTVGVESTYFGEHGYTLSTASSRLAIEVSAGDATVDFVAIGYRR